jgi:hypothetical protein
VTNKRFSSRVCLEGMGGRKMVNERFRLVGNFAQGVLGVKKER